MPQTAIVFGGSGFLGSHVADALTDSGFHVKILDIVPSPYLKRNQEMIVGDIRDLELVMESAHGCDYIYNFAGVADIDEAHFNPVKTANLNVMGTVNTLEAAKKVGIKRYIFASTVYVYSEQGSFYRASKQSAERFIETYNDVYGLKYTILRYGSLYGRRANNKNIIHKLLSDAINGRKMIYPGTGDELREYIHVTDAAKASVLILSSEYENQHIILTGNEKMRVRDLLKMITEVLGGRANFEFINSGSKVHYTVTPYSFSPKIGKKLAINYHTDLGQGLLDCLAEIHQTLRTGFDSQEDWLIPEEKK